MEGTCEIRAVVEDLINNSRLHAGCVIDAVDGVRTNGDAITDVLAMGIVGSTVKVRAFPSKTASSSTNVIEVELKRRKAGAGIR